MCSCVLSCPCAGTYRYIDVPVGVLNRSSKAVEVLGKGWQRPDLKDELLVQSTTSYHQIPEVLLQEAEDLVQLKKVMFSAHRQIEDLGS